MAWPDTCLKCLSEYKEEGISFQFLQLLRSPNETVNKDLSDQNVLHLRIFYVICLQLIVKSEDDT